jgi:hypothetical protein
LDAGADRFGLGLHGRDDQQWAVGALPGIGRAHGLDSSCEPLPLPFVADDGR